MSRPRGFTERLRARADRLRAALANPASLSRRAVSSSLWRVGGGGFEQALRLAGNLVLTRLLAPEDFGLMALAMSLQAGLMMATDVGLNLSVVRSDRGEDPRFLRTAWTIKVLRHAQLALLFVGMAALTALAPTVLDLEGTVYAAPDLPWVMAALAVPLAVKGFNSMNLALNERRMRLAPFVLLNAGTQIATLGCIIGFALIEPSVWALVWGGIAGALLRAAASHVVIPGPRMGFLLDREHAREIWVYGKWLMAASFFGFLAQQGDRLIFGALLDPTAFGIYAVARLWIDAAAGMISKFAQPVTNAALSEVRRENPKRLRTAFQSIHLAQNAACVASFGLFALAGPTLIELLYPPAFHAVGGLLILLSPLLLVRMWASYGSLLLTSGASRNYASVTLLRCVALFVTVPAAYLLFGERWAYFAVAINHVWGVPQQLRLARALLPVRYSTEIARLAGVVAVAFAVTVWA